MSRTIKNSYDSFSGFAFKSIDFSSDGIPLIRIGDINNSEIQFTENTAFLPDFFAEKYKRFLVQKGDVLIGLSGASLGKFGIYKQERKALVNQRILVLREKEDFQSSTQYLAYYLHILQKGIENKAVGGAQPNISPEKILRFEILHPIEDQLKIVGQLNRIQELIDKRVDTIQLVDNYIRSVFLEMFGDPILDSKKFGKKPLSFFGTWRSGGTPPKSQIEYYSGSIPWYTSGELNQIFINDSNEKITDQAIIETSAQHVESGSLLIGMYDTAALKTSITTVNASCNQAVAFAKLNNELCETTFIYFNIILSKEYYLNQRKGARQKNLNLTKIKNIEVLYPNIDHQRRFTKKFTSVESLKRNLNQSLGILNVLFQATVQTAFSPESRINEEEVFESLLETFTKEDLKQGNRLNHLLKWIDCKEPRFSLFKSYDLAWDRLRELLEDGSIEQVLDKNEIKLKIVE